MTKQRATFTGQELERALQKEIYCQIGATADERRSVELERAQFADAILRSCRHGSPGRETRRADRALHHPHRARSRTACFARGERPDVRHDATALTSSTRAVAQQRQFRRHHAASRRRAFRHATGAEGLALIDGQAGTGKSFTMARDPRAYEEAGHRVIGLAPTKAVPRTWRRRLPACRHDP